MEYVLLAAAGVLFAVGVYLFQQRWWEGRARDELVPHQAGRQAQAGFQRGRRVFDDGGGAGAGVDFQKYSRVSQLVTAHYYMAVPTLEVQLSLNVKTYNCRHLTS